LSTHTPPLTFPARLLFPFGRVAQLVRALLSHSRGPGFESLRAHFMRFSLSHVAATILLVATVAAAGAAQQLPTAQQAQTLLQNNPDIVQQLRERLVSSGLTPDQVRSRLAAEGYPPNLLDAYLAGGTASARDSLPGDDVLDAMRALGVTDSADIEGLRGATNRYQRLQQSRRVAPTVAATLTGAPPADGTQLFGLSVFRSPTSEFEPNLSGPVDANYRLGPGDQLVLILTGDVELTRELVVTREGFVLIPQVGQVPVANLTMAQLEDVLYTRLGHVYSGVKRSDATTHFSVSVSRLRSNQIFVNGDVLRPGSYRISSAGTALTALYAAGGPSDVGSLRAVSVRRAGQTVATLDVYDYLLRGDASHDVRLENGDIVFIPVHGARARIAGEVKRPATYELKEGETLADLVSAAGGFTAAAGLQHLRIERITPPAQRNGAGRDRVLIEVTSDQLTGGVVPALRIEPGDVVRVDIVDARVRSRILVSGNVWSPGPQGFVAGMPLSQALRGAGGAKPDTYLGEVLISRLQSDSSRAELRATLRDTTGAVLGTDPLLHDDDQIQVFSRTEFRPARYVAISGAVRKPGQYAYREGITMRDLVLLAGGLEEQADLRAAEIARVPADRSNGVTAQTFRVPLDSSYLGERGPDGKYLGPPGLPAAAGNTPEVSLVAYDNVLILPQPEWRLLGTVVISGEVAAPGRYAIENKHERISDLIKRAGGLLRTANADGAYYSRRRENVAYQSLADSLRAKRDTATRVGIDLVNVVADAASADNLLIENGDSLDIPLMHATVEVKGAVNAPTVVAIAPGESLEHYIRAAGGPNRRTADASGAYVIQPNGKIESRHKVAFIFRSDPTPRAGATVIVPVRDTLATSAATLQTITTVTSIIATLLTALAVLRI
jgi:polysaccharide biosynthesis/export protein